jgi:hypothetical protein
MSEQDGCPRRVQTLLHWRQEEGGYNSAAAWTVGAGSPSAVAQRMFFQQQGPAVRHLDGYLVAVEFFHDPGCYFAVCLLGRFIFGSEFTLSIPAKVAWGDAFVGLAIGQANREYAFAGEHALSKCARNSNQIAL